MRGITRLSVLVCAAALWAVPAHGQNAVVNYKATATTPGSIPVTPAQPLPVTGTFSVGSFVPSLSYGTLTATAASSASTALPTNTGTVAFQNQNIVAVSCTLAAGSATATTNEIIVPAGSTVFVGTTGYDHAACINQTGSASNIIVMAGGSGLGTGFGGGGGGGATSNFGSSFPSAGTAVGFTDGTNMVAGRVRNPGSGATTSDAAIVVVDPNSLAAIQSPVPLSVNGTAQGQTGLTPGVAQTGTIYAANIDLSSVKGIAALVGSGATGNGSPRVTVATDSATNAGAATVKGGVGVVNGGSTYNHIAASQTAQALTGGGGGATGDYLSHCVIYPSTTGAGSVTVFDNTNSAANNVIEFTTGTLSNLAPLAIPVGAVSVNGPWKVTTGANETVVCYGKFT